MEHHVAEMWTIDASDCLSIARDRGYLGLQLSKDLPELTSPKGLLVIIKLKSTKDFEIMRKLVEINDAIQVMK